MKRLAILALLCVAACKIPIGNVPCEQDSQCASGQICGSDGTCQQAPACTDGQRLCGNTCTPINTVTDCGACGNACAAGMACISGTCAIPVGQAVITAPAYADQGQTGLAATVTSNDPAATYAWTISGGAFADGTTQASGAVAHFTAGTGSFVTLEVVGSNNAGEHETGKATVALVAPLPPSIQIMTAPIVTANQANVAASATALTGATYAWTITNGTLGGTSGTSTTYTAGATGQVTLSVVATSLSGSTTSGQAVVQIAPAPGTIAITTAQSVAVGQTNISASVAVQAGVTLAWHITGGIFADTTAIATGANVSYTAGLGPAVVLVVTATNQAGAVQTGAVTIPVTIPTTNNLIAVGGANQVSLRWDGVSGATKYHVLRAGSASDTPVIIKDAPTTNFTDSPLPNGKRYYYQIEAATNYVDGAPSATQSAVTNLPAPTGLKATNGSSIVLTWNAVADATGYTVFRKTGTANFAAVGSSAGAATTFTDSNGLTEGLTYTYVVHALTADNESADSASASAVTTLDAPTGLTASVNVYDITLTWTANPAATGYDVLRSTSATGPFTVIDSVTSATYCDCGNTANPPAPATTYYFEVRATSLSTTSDVSNVATATTVFPPPASLSYTIQNRNTVVLTWAAVDGATGYSVQRSTSPNGPFTEIAQTGATTYTDANLPYATAFYYQIVVISAAGPSLPSPMVSLVTDASPYKRGAGVFGGEVQAVAFDPNDATAAWAGVQGGAGVYTSHDSGATWTANAAGLGVNSVHSLAFSQGTVFAGTRGAGVYTLASGANTWTAANTGLVATDAYTSLAADPGNSGTIYAASYAQVYLTANNGAKWTATSLVPTAPITALAISPVDPATVYAATDGAGLYMTSDSGAHWAAVGPATAGCQGGIVIDPSKPSNVWVGTTAGVLASTNGGQSWNTVGTLSQVRSIALAGGTVLASTSGGGMQISNGDGSFTAVGNYGPSTEGVTVMAVAGQTILAGSMSGAGIFRSGDSGSTWNAAATGLTAASAPGLAVSKSAPSNLYSVAGYTVVKSTDKGATWTSAMGSGISYPVITSAVAVDPTNPATVYIGAQGVLRSTNGGSTWASTNANFSASALALASASTAYAAVYDVGVYKSTNLNSQSPTWTAANTGLNSQGMRTVAVAPSSSSQVYAGGDHGFWASSDSGTTWTPPSQQQVAHVRAIAVHPTTPGTVYLVVAGGISGSQLRKSINAGATWTDLNFGSTSTQNLSSIAIDATNPSILFALGTGNNGGLGGLYKSTNGGVAWTDVSSGLGTRNLRGVVLDPATSGTLFVASDDNGLLVSTSGGL